MNYSRALVPLGSLEWVPRDTQHLTVGQPSASTHQVTVACRVASVSSSLDQQPGDSRARVIGGRCGEAMGMLSLDRLKTSSRPHSNIDEWKARMQDTPPAEMHVIRPLHTILGTYPAINKGYALF